MRSRLAGGVLLVVLALAWVAGAPLGAAHALLVSSDPPANAVLAAGPPSVTLTFTEAPDPRLSSVKVLDRTGASVTSGTVTAVSLTPTALRVPLQALPNGIFTVAWRTVSAVDGHIATGAFAFTVGPPPSAGTSGRASGALAATEGAASGASPATILGRWLLYVGLVILLGTSLLGALGGLARSRASDRLLGLAWAVASVGTLVFIAAGAADAGADLGVLAGSSLGQAALLRLIPMAVALVAIRVADRQGLRPEALGAAAVSAAAAMLVDAAWSHAASGPLPWPNIAVQWLHILAVGAWLGALPALLLGVQGAPSGATAALARRFATWATFGIAGVGLTGVARAVVEVGTPGALVSSDFGWLVVVKSVLLVGLAGLGALNHFRNVPAAGRDLRGLRRAGSLELGLGAVVLLVAALLVNIAPPIEVVSAVGARSATGPSPSPVGLTVEGHDYATTIRLRLTAAPGQPGQNAFTATVVDYDSGAPVPAARILLRFQQPDRPDIGASSLTLTAAGDGRFTGSGANLSLDGAWTIEAVVDETTTSAVALLQLTIAAPQQQVDVNRAPGAPTVYTVHLSGGRTVQVYLDPGTPGPNDLHATWFDATGTELPVRDVVFSLVSGDATPAKPAVNVLDPGHEVARVTVASTPVTFAIVATTAAGDPLEARLQITPGS